MAARTPKIRPIEATNTQKTILIALAEGWRLRLAHHHGWCLFQAGRGRPFAQLKTSTIDKMTAAGWLTAGIATKELSFRPEKVLTTTGRKCAEHLISTRWAEDYEWEPCDIAGSIEPFIGAHDDALAA